MCTGKFCNQYLSNLNDTLQGPQTQAGEVRTIITTTVRDMVAMVKDMEVMEGMEAMTTIMDMELAMITAVGVDTAKEATTVAMVVISKKLIKPTYLFLELTYVNLSFSEV